MSAPVVDRPAPAGSPARKPPRTWVRWLLFALCLPLVAMWVYAYGFASKKATVHIDDRAWAERGQQICAAANAQRDELFDPRHIDAAGPDALLERADIVDQATDIVERMLDEVVAEQPDSAGDRAIVAQWEGYYRTLIQNRREYTAKLRAGGANRFDESMVEGQPLSDFIDDFAKPNYMPDCVSPNDLS